MNKNRSAAPGPVVPVLVYDDVGRAIKWLCETFGFVERFQYGSEGSPSGAQLAVGDGSVFLTSSRLGQSPNWTDQAVLRTPRLNEITHGVCVHIEDVDSLYQCIKQSDARIFSAPETHPFGERQFTVEDIGGHRWTFTQSVANIAPEDWGGRSAKKTL
jgi:uncharacterized glyoxalase superfamily protein PhnB